MQVHRLLLILPKWCERTPGTRSGRPEKWHEHEKYERMRCCRHGGKVVYGGFVVTLPWLRAVIMLVLRADPGSLALLRQFSCAALKPLGPAVSHTANPRVTQAETPASNPTQSRVTRVLTMYVCRGSYHLESQIWEAHPATCCGRQIYRLLCHVSLTRRKDRSNSTTVAD